MTQSEAPSRVEGCRPQLPAGRRRGKSTSNARPLVRQTARGAAAATRARKAGSAARSSSSVTRVLSVTTRLTTSVKPIPSVAGSERSSSGPRVRATSGEAESAAQKPLPRCA